MVKRPEDYEYSGHRAYLGSDKSGLVDVEPVLRHFGGTKRRAVEVYTRFVESEIGQPSQEDYYRASEGTATGKRGVCGRDTPSCGRTPAGAKGALDRIGIEELLRAGVRSSGLSVEELCSQSKAPRTVAVREAVIVVGRERGLSNRELATGLGIDPSAVTRRVDAARGRDSESGEVIRLRKELRSKDQDEQCQQSQA